MNGMETLCTWFGIERSDLTMEELILLEAELFARMYEELKEFFSALYRDYFRLINYTVERVEKMMELHYMRCVINDILQTKEYNLSGIAMYTQISEDVIFDVAAGLNTTPSIVLHKKLLELHRSVRRELYDSIILKIKNKLFGPTSI